MRITYDLMWLSMRNILFHVPQAKGQMLLCEFGPAGPLAPNGCYSNISQSSAVSEVHGCRVPQRREAVSKPKTRCTCGAKVLYQLQIHDSV
jgi:hypothetical protein